MPWGRGSTWKGFTGGAANRERKEFDVSIPLKDDLLVPYLLNWNTRLTTGFASYGVTEDQATQFSALFLPYQTAYTLMINSRAAGTRSKSQTALKDQTKLAVLTYARMLYAGIQVNLDVADNLKTLMGVEIRKARPSPIPAPTQRPVLAITKVNGRTISMHITDGSVGGRARKAANAVAAWVYYFVGTVYPPDPGLWAFTGATSKYDYQITLPNDVSGGATVWVCAAWINGKQMSGPVSVPQMTHLQGGGVSEQPAAVKIAA